MLVGRLLHAPAPEPDQLQDCSLIEHPGSEEGTVFAKAVTCGRRRPDAPEPEHQGARHVHQGDSRLHVIGENEVFLRALETKLFHVQIQDL
jgi:hypothetical protein